MMTAYRPPRTLTWPTLPPAANTAQDVSALNEDLEFCGVPCRHHPRSDKYPYVGEGKHIPGLQKFAEDLANGLEGVFPNRQATYNRVHALLISWGDNDDLGTKTEVDRLKEIFESKTKYNFTAEHYEIPPERSKQRLERHCVNVREDHCCLASDLLIVYYGGHGIFKLNKSIWHAWKVKPSNATTERESSPELDWTEAQRSLMTADGDVLFILDCCYATFTSKVEPEGGSKELLAATSFKQKATGVGDNSFTMAFVRELENTKLLPYTAIQIHERLLNNYHQYNIAVPQYVGLYCPPGSKSIVLVPQKADIPSGSQLQAVASGTLIHQPTFITDCRILISVALDNPYQPPDLSQWRDWFTKAAPRNIGGVNFSIEKYVRAEGAWESTSTLYFFSLPAALWNSMPSNGAYKMLGIIKSGNLLKPQYSSRGTQAEMVADDSLSRRFRPLKLNTIKARLEADNKRINLNLSFGQNPFATFSQDVDQDPFRLVWEDILSVFQLSRLLPLIILPIITPFNSGPLDELYPLWSNIWALTLHMVLFPIQLLMIVTLPLMAVLFWFLPGFVNLLYFVAFFAVTFLLKRLLNGPPTTEVLVGLPPDGVDAVNDEHELWFFINGVATGKDWYQSNLNLLAQTFQREVVGIRNITAGFIFDLIECFIQRDLDYKTRDIRIGRAQLRAALTAPATKKVVLITHSQGGIEGSSIIDWLLISTSTEALSKLEVYSFGNAARHFSNPLIKVPSPTRSVGEATGYRGERVFKYIEHYANSKDFVANIGVLRFTSPQARPYRDGNPFYGPVFIREGSGHLLNMHYLDTMFTMIDGKVDNNGNKFMNSIFLDSGIRGEKVNGQRVKDVSRLWQYKNGENPKDD